jgi:hypothetical protein
MARDKTLEKALDRLRKPGRELVLTCTPDTVSGRAFYIMPDGVRVADETAQKLLEDPSIQPYSDGLFPGHPQSYRLTSDWRSRTR